MSFTLFIFMCSITLNHCDGPYMINKKFNDYSSCALFGYEESGLVLRQFETEDMNKNEYYTKFYCKKNESI